MPLIASTEYGKIELSNGEILLMERFGPNMRWFESKSHYRLWMRYNRH